MWRDGCAGGLPTLRVIDEKGIAVESYRYAPFGEQIASKRPHNLHGQQGFVGGIHESNDLVYLKHRYYNPRIGRFYQPDPVTFLSGGMGQINRYQYGWNDPLTFKDPSGLNPEYNFNIGMYLPALPQTAVDFSAGLGDSILFGYGDNLRSQLNIDGGVNRNSAAYSNGETASLLMGTAGTSRATYVLASKALSRSRNERVLTSGSNVRNFLKRWTGPALVSKTERAKIKTFTEHVGKKGFEQAALGLGRTRESYNKALIPLSLGQGARLNTMEHEHD